jgi:hypothetical protein
VFYGGENPRKFDYGIFGCIPHARGALFGSGGGSDMNTDYLKTVKVLHSLGNEFILTEMEGPRFYELMWYN